MFHSCTGMQTAVPIPGRPAYQGLLSQLLVSCMGGAGAPKTPAEGADTAIWLATAHDDGPHGGFFQDRRSISW